MQPVATTLTLVSSRRPCSSRRASNTWAAPVQAGALGVARGALVEADEHVPFRLGHSLSPWSWRLPPRRNGRPGQPPLPYGRVMISRKWPLGSSQ